MQDALHNPKGNKKVTRREKKKKRKQLTSCRLFKEPLLHGSDQGIRDLSSWRSFTKESEDVERKKFRRL